MVEMKFFHRPANWMRCTEIYSSKIEITGSVADSDWVFLSYICVSNAPNQSCPTIPNSIKKEAML